MMSDRPNATQYTNEDRSELEYLRDVEVWVDAEIVRLESDNAKLAKINAEHIQLSANKDLRIAELVHHRDHGGEIDRLENDRRRKYLQRTEDANRYLAARVDEFEYLLTEMNESIEEHGHAAIAKDKAFHLRIKSALSTTGDEVKPKLIRLGSEE